MRFGNPRTSITRVRRVLGELDYAQRRLFEIRTGVPISGPSRSRRDIHEISELDALFHHGPLR